MRFLRFLSSTAILQTLIITILQPFVVVLGGKKESLSGEINEPEYEHLYKNVDLRDSASVESKNSSLEKKLEKLRYETTRCASMWIGGDSSGCGLIKEIRDPEEYAEFVFQSPRPYHLFILFTMKGCCNMRRGHCNRDCGKSEATFKKVAASYHAIGEHQNYFSGRGKEILEMGIEKQPAFFAIVNCDEKSSEKNDKGMSEMCRMGHKLDSVPKLVHARGGSLRKKNNSVQFVKANVLNLKDWMDAQKMLDWVKARAPRDNLKLYQDLFSRLWLMLPIIVYGSLALCVLISGAILVRLVPIIMVIGACLIQWLGCSGITYNIIHGMQWYGHSGEVVARSNRSQYLMEGLSCSGLFMSGGLSMVAALYLSRNKYGNHTKAVLADFLGCIMVIICFASSWTLMSIYTSYKASWYESPGILPPPNYKTGPMNIDRGLSFVNTDSKAFYESGDEKTVFSIGAIVSNGFNIVETFTKMGRKFLQKSKKLWNQSDLISFLDFILAGCFDFVWFPFELSIRIFGRDYSHLYKKKGNKKGKMGGKSGKGGLQQIPEGMTEEQYMAALSQMKAKGKGKQIKMEDVEEFKDVEL